MKTSLHFALILGLLAAFSVPGLAHADTWTIDGAHSHVGFKVRHMMVSWTRGSFGTAEGTVDIDGTDLKTLKVEATIDVASVDTANEKRDAHLRNEDFFDVANHPSMTFKSTAVKPKKDGGFVLVGDLTIKGVTKSVSLDSDGFQPPQQDPWGNTKSGISASTTIDRKDWGLTYNKALETGGVVIGDEVHIQLDVELNLSK